MSYPVLFDHSATEFDSNGIGILSDAVSCIVSTALNGFSTLEMKYPSTGRYFQKIERRMIVAVPDSVGGSQQGFRIYRITKPITGICTVYAYHIVYDLAGVAVEPYSAYSCASALSGIKEHAVNDCPFSFWTDKETVSKFTVDVPTQANQLIGGHAGSVLDVYGGEYEFDNFTVKLHSHRGTDRGVSVSYGKNIMDYKQEEDCENVYTGVMPYWKDTEGNVVQLSEKVVEASGDYEFTKIKVVDASTAYKEQPTEEQLRNWASSYVKNNSIGIPSVNWTIDFLSLDKTEEYKNISSLRQRVWIGDTVKVIFPMYNVTASARCVGTTYNVLTERYDKVSLGSVRSKLSTQNAQEVIKSETNRKEDITALQNAINSATAHITGNKGGYVVLHSSTGAKEPDEVLIMDTPDIATATRVWRWNKSGLGYSSTGYNGPYGLAMTQDGAIVADFITTGTLNAALANIINIDASNINTGTLRANLIKAGILKSSDGSSYFDLDNGNCYLGGTFKSKDGHYSSMIGNGGVVLHYDDEEVGSIHMNIAKESFSSLHKYYLGSYKSSPQLFAYLDGGKRALSCDILNGNNVSWQWDGNIGKYVLVAD